MTAPLRLLGTAAWFSGALLLSGGIAALMSSGILP